MNVNEISSNLKALNWWKIGVFFLSGGLLIGFGSYFLFSQNVIDLLNALGLISLDVQMRGFYLLFVVFVWLIIVLVSLFLYFLPSIFALANNHYNLVAIVILNLFLGWTYVGWILSLVWAFKKPYEHPQKNSYGI